MADLSSFPITRRWPARNPDILQLYSINSPNGVKASIMLEETGLPYEPHLIVIGDNESWTPEFLSLNPNGKIPAIIDPDGPGGRPIGLFESGAILLYLSEKTNGRFMASKKTDRFEIIQWLMFQMGGVGPMFGQVHHFVRSAPEPVPYAIERYSKETRRLYGVLDAHLASREWLGSEYSVADIATYPWVARHEWHKVELEDYPNVKRWFDHIGARPAVQRGMKVPVR